MQKLFFFLLRITTRSMSGRMMDDPIGLYFNSRTAYAKIIFFLRITTRSMSGRMMDDPIGLYFNSRTAYAKIIFFLRITTRSMSGRMMDDPIGFLAIRTFSLLIKSFYLVHIYCII